MSKQKYQGKTSQQIQSEFNDVCFKLGQEIGNERRAIQNQDTLKELQEELEKAFYAAVTREQEAAAAKKRADDNTKAFEEKAKAQSAPSGEAEQAAS